ncbi:MAG: AIR synthase-related protein [Bacteroidales bacterium]|nr:AIR synthase-related protein [Bacteroidales bacterium]
MMKSENAYDQYGASSQKQDVFEAIKNLSRGISDTTFCNLFRSPFDKQLISLHADGAGTKSALAYVYYKETGDIKVWENLAVDAIVMNTDDMLCVGITGPFYLTNIIGRNKNLINLEVISAIIRGFQNFSEKMAEYDINLILTGGETADIGDLTKTLTIDVVAASFISENDYIDNKNIKAGDVIIGFESTGQALWEDHPNSGIGSNGLTLARHTLLKNIYKNKYPESYDYNTEEKLIYNGSFLLTDTSPIDSLDMGKYLLSPTKTYLPIVKEVFKYYKKDIHGLIHCTGGGQLKVKRFVNNLRIVKNNLFDVPQLFRLIQTSTNLDWKQMYEIFNMGHRLEMYISPELAKEIIIISEKYNVKAQIIGYVETADNTEIVIESDKNIYVYS